MDKTFGESKHGILETPDDQNYKKWDPGWDSFIPDVKIAIKMTNIQMEIMGFWEK